MVTSGQHITPLIGPLSMLAGSANLGQTLIHAVAGPAGRLNGHSAVLHSSGICFRWPQAELL